ncbi:UvrD-helicase domain-containing protein [Hyphomicrobium sp.]|uniref:UvrD-helicase domain-containing protein n=1 Tax=Hyphomicrobium sp. TaxID=82 RepID=UPI0025BFD7FF|nr:UvrD-helicase domain-containing protein [Hyphomicrobium sp.]MCC7250462.1 UvrD-helicase domain-containing protein [Hyphomicrobium sp.]
MQPEGSPEIRRSVLSWLLRSLFGSPLRSLRLAGHGIDLAGGRQRQVRFTEMAGPARASGSGAIIFPLADASELRASGFRQADVPPFVQAVNEARRHCMTELFDQAQTELAALAQAKERLDQPRRYPAACLLKPFVKRAERIFEGLPRAAPADLLLDEQKRMFDAASALRNEPAKLREAAIKAFIETELIEMKEFFDAIDAHPLTAEQRLAIVTDEDATLILAGAGSGKTSVIVGKAAYLIERGIRSPDEILLLAFGKDAAEEMAGRIRQRCGAPVDAMTFHALGYEIIRQVEGQAPALAAHASDDAQFFALLRDILASEIATRAGSCALLLSWFAEFYRPWKTEWDFSSADEYARYVRVTELRTLQGERVRSFEELVIANWLYLNGIAYEYEPDYEHVLSENTRRAYTPDFRLIESGVYIEHFGVRRERGPGGETRLTTAPHVDRERYLEGMVWKRKVHKAHGTVLIETYSYENVEGRLLEELAKKLEPYAKTNPIPPAAAFERLSQLGLVDAFTQTLGIFLRHFKSRGLTLENCRERAGLSSGAQRSQAFLKIFELVLEAYQARLGERIDFEDMINRAADHVHSGRFRSPYRHVLVDEFQDISDGRAGLLLALKAQHEDARIFAVGDDWQSIYRFAGSDLNLMRRFGEVFGGAIASSNAVHSVVDLGRTFRNTDRIALAARRFILKNPSQLEKQVIPAAQGDDPAISLVYCTRSTEGEALRAVLDEICERSSGRASVLLLGRYRFVQPDNLAALVSEYPELDMRFLTVHRSKGLEADHVIVLRAARGRMGFPSEIVDDSLLDLVLPEPEGFEHAEERRLFYVALTRARHSVTILTDPDAPSAFVTELLEDKAYGAVLLDDQGVPSRAASYVAGPKT